jgi:hypothetical protein
MRKTATVVGSARSGWTNSSQRKQNSEIVAGHKPSAGRRPAPGAAGRTTRRPRCSSRTGLTTRQTGPSRRLAGTRPTQKVTYSTHGARLRDASRGPVTATTVTRTPPASATIRKPSRVASLSRTRCSRPGSGIPEDGRSSFDRRQNSSRTAKLRRIAAPAP